MSEGGGGWFEQLWDKVCPCRLIRKNIVMTTLVILSFALVTWTVMATMEAPKPPPPSNVTYVMIDDTKELELLNFTMKTVLTKQQAKPKKAKAAPPDPKPAKSELKSLRQSDGEDLCKCLCKMNVTEEEMLEALKIVVLNKKLEEEGTEEGEEEEVLEDDSEPDQG